MWKADKPPYTSSTDYAATGETERLDVRDVYLIARNHPRTTLELLCLVVLAVGTLFI